MIWYLLAKSFYDAIFIKEENIEMDKQHIGTTLDVVFGQISKFIEDSVAVAYGLRSL